MLWGLLPNDRLWVKAICWDCTSVYLNLQWSKDYYGSIRSQTFLCTEMKFWHNSNLTCRLSVLLCIHSGVTRVRRQVIRIAVSFKKILSTSKWRSRQRHILRWREFLRPCQTATTGTGHIFGLNLVLSSHKNINCMPHAGTHICMKYWTL